MLSKLKNSFSGYYKKAQNFEYKNLVYVSVFLVVLIIFWKQLIGLFKPKDDARGQDTAVTKKNNEFKATGSITSDGRFITGAGVITKYTVSQAKMQAEQLAALMNTYKGAQWYSITWSFFGFGSVSRIKAYLNPGYPASYRRYVAACYRDVYTANRNLAQDVRDHLTGFGGSGYWTADLDKYFIF